MPDSRALKLSTAGDCEIVLARAFRAPSARLFEALTTPALVRRWLLGPPGWAMTVCDIELRIGGAYRYEWRHANGATLGAHGVFREIEPPWRLSQTENFDAAWYPGQALVTTTLEERGETTLFAALLAYDSREARDIVLGSAMESGVAASYDRLEALLAERGEG